MPEGERRTLPLLKTILEIIGGLAAAAALVAIAVNIYGNHHAGTAQAEYGRLDDLSAGVSLQRFEDVLEEDGADVTGSMSGGRRRHVYERAYDYVRAVTNRDDTVVAFSVTVRKAGFHPEFDGITLGRTPVGDAWESPGSLAGDCGRPVAYFETSLPASTAEPIVRAVGLTALGHSPGRDLDVVCDSALRLFHCGGQLAGSRDLTPEAVACFVASEEGQRLRAALRPNTYAEGAPYQELSHGLISLSESDRLALGD